MFGIVIGIFYWVYTFLEEYTQHNEFVEVPKLNGFQSDYIEEFMMDKNLRFEIYDSIYNPNNPKVLF